MASELSPFVLQKIRERKALKEPEEAEEHEEPEDETEEEEEEEREEPASLREEPPRKKSHHAIGERSSHGSRSGARGGSLTDRASKFFKNLGPTQTVLLIGGGLLVANHLMVPRGTSVLSQILNAIAPAPKARPRLQPSYYSGANWGAGWNRGTMPYGPWAHANPGGPSPYAHGESFLGW